MCSTLPSSLVIYPPNPVDRKSPRHPFYRSDVDNQVLDERRTWRMIENGLEIIRFIPIKPMVATASAVRESYAVHSRPP
jgi:hypothetical protein